MMPMPPGAIPGVEGGSGGGGAAASSGGGEDPFEAFYAHSGGVV